jgi:hypothetical protein
MVPREFKTSIRTIVLAIAKTTSHSHFFFVTQFVVSAVLLARAADVTVSPAALYSDARDENSGRSPSTNVTSHNGVAQRGIG